MSFEGEKRDSLILSMGSKRLVAKGRIQMGLKGKSSFGSEGP